LVNFDGSIGVNRDPHSPLQKCSWFKGLQQIRRGSPFDADLQWRCRTLTARIDHVAFEHGRPLAGRIGDKVGRMLDDRGRQPFALVDGIALIPIEGTLVHKGGMLGFTGHDLDAF
jgi:hypothetical protein